MAKTHLKATAGGKEQGMPDAHLEDVEHLFLDPKNPRLTGETYNISDQDLCACIKYLLWLRKGARQIAYLWFSSEDSFTEWGTKKSFIGSI